MMLGFDLTKSEPAITGSRVERQIKRDGLLDKIYRRVTGYSNLVRRTSNSIAAKQFVSEVNSYSDKLDALDDGELSECVIEAASALRLDGLEQKHVAHAFALIREIAHRKLGQRHYDTQVIGGWLLMQGMVAEMPTGDGKTLTATLSAGTAAMARLPVHILTVNDYLTTRDAHEMSPIYRELGLSVGVVVHGDDNEERKQAYAKDIVYCTSKEIVFDYLRDRIVLGGRRSPLQQRIEPIFGSSGCHQKLLTKGLHYAIVDEADSVLIDEARTPLIISGQDGGQYESIFLQQALEIAEKLEVDRDFRLLEAERRIELKPEGRDRIKQVSSKLGPLWSGKIRREEAVSQALSAIHLFQLDQQYLIRDGKVEIIDSLSGRVAEGRSWERGLHQLIELKEGCEMSRQQSTLARISYQDFFQRYLHLSGMTGTASEVRQELWEVYHLHVATVPSYRPCIRNTMKTHLLDDSDAKWRKIAERAKALVAEGRAVLVGTSSVAASEEAAIRLQESGLEFNLLNARQDKMEADIVAQAGQVGRITIATSMAGRGTDIKLADAVRDAGGLHVILSEHFDAARVDRQLEGRCGRQGDPGSFEMILSLADIQFLDAISRWLANAAIMKGLDQGIGKLFALMALKLEQRRRERKSYKERMATRKFNKYQEELLALSGRAE